MFLLRNINNTYFITSINLIENKKIASLRSKLEDIKALSNEDLKNLSWQTLTNNELSDKGGAGIGLIEIARKSNKKIKFDFESFNNNFSLFYIQIETGNEDIHITMDSSKALYKILNSKNIHLLYKDNFSQKKIISLLEMIENNLSQDTEDNFIRKKVYYLLVELLQNILEHSKEYNNSKKGILLLSKEKNKYIINTGSIIDNKKVESLKAQLNNIISLDKDELTELFKRKLLEEKSKKSDGAGIGLIEVAKYSSDKLEFEFNSYDEDSSFLSLSAKI